MEKGDDVEMEILSDIEEKINFSKNIEENLKKYFSKEFGLKDEKEKEKFIKEKLNFLPNDFINLTK